MRADFMFTSESVTDGHPDKLCDQISDAILGRYLRQDRMASVIAECAISTGIVFVAARVASTANIDIPTTARNVILRAGYGHNGFDVRNCTVMTSVTDLPPALTREAEDELAEEDLDRILVQDQATVFGYACDHSENLMPLPIWLSHKLARRISNVRRRAELPYLAPDAKTQVGVEYHGHEPTRVHSISIVASQHEADSPTPQQLRDDVVEQIILPSFEDEAVNIDRQTKLFINPAGPVVGGGPALHSGMTGRKTAVDTYGEYSRCSSSALSGKDPSRIDRVGAYAARHAAKNVVAAGLAHQCEVQLSYTIGLAGPVSVQVETYGSGRVSDAEIADRLTRTCDFRIADIIRRFELRDLPQHDEEGFYPHLAAFGHVGRTDLQLPWERLDAAEALIAG
jgi:S-adenosylmethionine synthetase